MRRYWSLFARLAALLVLVVFGGQLVLLGFYLSNRGRVDMSEGYRLPLPGRVAAIVDLVEAGNADAVLRAVNSDELAVLIDPRRFGTFESEPFRIAAVERHLDRYGEAFDGRRFAAFIAGPQEVPADAIRLRDKSLWSSYPLRLAIELNDGHTLVVETRESIIDAVYDLPVGFAAGIIALVSALIVLFALHRETTPLRRLAKDARMFGETGRQRSIPLEGARETRDLIAAFNTMQCQVVGLLQDRNVMLGALGHDLRTHLARLRLRAEETPDPLRTALVRDIERMAVIAENSMTYAAAGRADGPRDIAALRPLLTDFAPPGGAVELGDVIDVSILFDAEDLRRVLENLVDNALKFAGRCRLSARELADHAEIAIVDHGPGLPMEEREAVLKPFARLDAARTQGVGGTGLGLAIVDLLVRRNGGSLRLEETPGGGLTVMVSAAKGT